MDELKTVLVVDDSPINRELLKIIFANTYSILEAADGEECIAILEEHSNNISAILLDLYMPNLDGIGVLKYMKSNKMVYNIPVIIITGESKLTNIQVEAFDLGAADFLFKPFVPEVILHRVKNLIDLYSYKSDIEHSLEIKSRELEESKKLVEETNEFLVDALSAVVEFRNLESGEHIKRVKAFTNILANWTMVNYHEYKLDDNRVKLITSAAALHDIGKIGISDAILLKPGKLTEEEFEEMKNHTVYGADLLKHFILNGNNSEFFRTAAEIARHHHERYDGNGYPDRLSGENIPIESQIVALADVYDALVSKRVYKSAFDIEDAYKMIINGECGNFSPKLIHIFIVAKPDIIKATQENSTI